MMKSMKKSSLDKKGYGELQPDEKRLSISSDSTLLEEGLHEDSDIEPFKRQIVVRKTPRWMWYTHAALISISAAFFVAAWFGQPEEFAYVRKFSSWSPALPAVRYEKVDFNITVEPNSPYVGASPQVDKMWNALSYDIGDQMVTHEQMKKLGKPEDSLHITNPKTGETGYKIGIEVFHQLHCLNLLRKNTYREYYQPLGGDFADPLEKQRWHMDHCVEILRLALMCSSDTGVFTYHTVDNYDVSWHPKSKPWPDYHTPHVCKNFDAIRDWALENTVAHEGDGI